MLSTREMFQRRKMRNRTALKRKSSGQPRLSIHRTSKHIYAQIIDDAAGRTLTHASTLDADFKAHGVTGADKKAATMVGALVAQRAAAQNIHSVVFDRGGFMFHGRVKALADAAREAGLQF